MKHPNRLPFRGVLTLIDVASDIPPFNSSPGWGSHNVILTRTAAEAALPSLLGMAISHRIDWKGHDPRRKVGVISAARIEGDELVVEGHVFAHDFPEVEAAAMLHGGELGMSFDAFDAGIANMLAKVWTLTRITFTGAAILLRKDAAFLGTSFAIRPAAEDLPGNSQ